MAVIPVEKNSTTVRANAIVVLGTAAGVAVGWWGGGLGVSDPLAMASAWVVLGEAVAPRSRRYRWLALGGTLGMIGCIASGHALWALGVLATLALLAAVSEPDTWRARVFGAAVTPLTTYIARAAG